MRNAIVVAVTIEAHCPNCQEPIAEPDSGSFCWDTNSIPSGGRYARCLTCNTVHLVKLPKALRAL